MKDRQMYESCRQGQFLTMHRCEECWRHLAYPHEDGHSYAIDNGFVPADRVYPHSQWCKQRGKF